VTNAACLQAGEILAGKFCVERIIATGGVGVVVAARHMQLGETVALKFLIPQADRDATDVARFVREAQSAVKLKNEHVARVLDVGSLDDGSPFMVMEYLEGSDLDQMLRTRGPLPITDAVDYVLQACEAIAEAHHLGIVHRDIKPSNFFLTRRTDGSPLIKVLDFGIAKARAELQQDLSLTKTRTVLGSPVYMSPEQIRSARSVDHRTDIWSLGVTIYELLTDQLPFDGDSITGVAAAVSTDPIAPIRALRPEIPACLAVVVEKCLEKKPVDRYQNIADFAAALVPYGSETARYSLTRIRGALNLRAQDPNAEADTLVANGGGLAEAIATTVGVALTARSEPRSGIQRRRVLVSALTLLTIVGLVSAYAVFKSPQPVRPTASEKTAAKIIEGEGSAPIPNAAGSHDVPMRTAEAATSISAQLSPNPALPSASSAPGVTRAGTTFSARRSVSARVNGPAGGAKSSAEKSSSRKDAQTRVHYDAIFDTRK
jgi:serine/threonine-protein kinase